jgi:hypothetical protein
MKITDLRIFDTVCNKTSKFPMQVVGIFADPIDNDPLKGTAHPDFEGNEGDIWEEEIEDIEFCKPTHQ